MFRKPTFLSALLGAALSAGVATACAFHIALPEATIVDRLLETENVVLARPDQDDPFRFTAVAALEGTLEQADLPTLVDSTTRRRLALNPDDSVLFARDGGGYGPFKRLTYVDKDVRQVVEVVMARKQGWITGEADDRFQFFAGLIDHPNRSVRELALKELDAASYSELRDLDIDIQPDKIMDSLWNISEMPLVPIRILLLGLSDDAAARQEVVAWLEASAKGGSVLNIGPLATAVVELEGAEGIARLERLFLQDRTQTGTVLELVVEALAIHASAGSQDRRQQVLEALAEFVAARPDVSDTVARQFQNRYDFGMVAALQGALESGQITSARAVIPVSSYIFFARQGEDTTKVME